MLGWVRSNGLGLSVFVVLVRSCKNNNWWFVNLSGLFWKLWNNNGGGYPIFVNHAKTYSNNYSWFINLTEPLWDLWYALVWDSQPCWITLLGSYNYSTKMSKKENYCRENYAFLTFWYTEPIIKDVVSYLLLFLLSGIFYLWHMG